MSRTHKYTSVWLARDIEFSHLFFCPQCQCPLFSYHGSIVMMAPGQMEMEFPLTIQCKNKNCDAAYIIEAIVPHE